MTFQQLFFITMGLGILTSCKPKFDTPEADNGDIDASNYVALGSSMTAGSRRCSMWSTTTTPSFRWH